MLFTCYLGQITLTPYSPQIFPMKLHTQMILYQHQSYHLGKVLVIVTDVLSKWDLKVNTAKTEWTPLILAEDPTQRGQEEWRSARSLGFLLGDDSQDISQRKQLSAAAYWTLMTVWCRRLLISESRRLRLYNALYYRFSRTTVEPGA